MSTAGRRLPSLDGMRGVSIILVLVAHCASTPHAYPLSFLYYTGELGLFGVKVFFVISGFLITDLLLREQDRTGKISLRDFYLRRIRRIFPAFYAFLLCAALLARLGAVTIPFSDFVHAATFTANLFPVSWELLHIWSLSAEEQFYLLWPLLLIVLGAKWALRFVALLALAVPYLAIFALHGHLRLAEAVSGLATGCVLGGWRAALHANRHYSLFVTNLWTATCLAVSLFALESLHRYPFYDLLTPLTSVLIGFLLDSVVTSPLTAVGRFLNMRPLMYVGVLSYSIYLWQQIFLNHWGTHWFNIFPINLFCALSLAIVSFYVVERPFLRVPIPKMLTARHSQPVQDQEQGQGDYAIEGAVNKHLL